MTADFQPYDLVVRNAATIPNDIAITDGAASFTWQQLSDFTKRIAGELRERGVKPGDLVGVRLPPMLTCLVSWAVFHEAAVLISFNDLIENHEELVPTLVVHNQADFAWTRGATLEADENWLKGLKNSSVEIAQNRYPSADSVFRYSMSSGTTGRPKVIALPMRVVNERAALAVNALEANNLHMNLIGSRAEGGFYSFYGSAITGKTYLVPRTSRGPLQILKDHSVDVVKGSPLHLSRLAHELEMTGQQLPDLKRIIVAGSRLPEALHTKLFRLTRAVIGNAYGATELLSIAMRLTASDDMSDMGTIAPGATVEIVDPETRAPLPDGEVGLIRARGTYMPSEYIGNPDATSRHLIDGWFYPGDLGTLEHGHLFLRGRVTELINAGGLKVDPHVVEDAFNAIAPVEECAAFGFPNAVGIHQVAVAYVSDLPIDEQAVSSALRSSLGNATPVRFFRVPSIPRGETGKVARGELSRTLVDHGDMPQTSRSVETTANLLTGTMPGRWQNADEFDVLQPYDYILRNAKSDPDGIAITDGETTQTWKSLFELTKRMARELRDRGVEPGDVIGVRLPPMLTCLVSWAVFHEAAIVVPFNPEMVDEDSLNLKLVLSNAPIDGLSPEKSVIVSNEWFVKIHMNSTIIDQKRYPNTDSIFRYALSSGTTGRPKVMPFSIATTAIKSIDVYRSSRSTTIPMYLMATRSEGGFCFLYASAMIGATYLVPQSAEHNIAMIQKYRVDVLRASPAQLAPIVAELEKRGERLPDVTIVLPAGGELPAGLVDKVRSLTSAAVGNSLGATEVGAIAMRWTDSPDPRHIGEISPGTTVQIVDEETHHVLPDGEVGLLRVKSETMITEYLNAPEATEKAFRDGWFYPGDYARLDHNNLFLHGRASENINSGGVKTDPKRVDEAYEGVGFLKDWAAFGMPDKDGIPRVALAYVADEKHDAEELREVVLDKLRGRTPVAFFRVTEIPRGETGKVLRGQLAEMVADGKRLHAERSETRPANVPRRTTTSTTRTRTRRPIPAGLFRDAAPEDRDLPGREVSWPLHESDVLQPYDYLVRNVAERPDGIALTDGDKTLTWRQLFDMTKRVAGELRERGVKPGDIVGVSLPPFRSIIVMWAVFHEAAVFTAVTPEMLVSTTLNLAIVVTDKHLPDWSREQTVIADYAWLSSIRETSTSINQMRYDSNDSICRMSLTSGSTGDPKALAFSIAASAVRAVENHVRTGAAVKAMSFMAPRSQGWHVWYYNAMFGTTYLVPGDPAQNIELIRRYQVDVIRASPLQLSGLIAELESTGTTLPELRLVLPTGGRMPDQLKDALRRVTDAQIGNAYGASEVGAVSIRRVDSENNDDAGEVFPDVELEIIDAESGETMPDGEVGVVRIRSHLMATEYVNAPDVNAEHFRDGWFYPGDLGSLDGRHLVLGGRLNELVNVGGSKVNPVTIDEAFARFDGVDDCATFAIPGIDGISRLALAYVADRVIDPDDARAFLVREIGTKVPSVFVRVPLIPRSDTGKIQRHRLADELAGTHTTLTDVNATAENDVPTFVQPFEYARRAWKENPAKPALIESTGVVSHKEQAVSAKQFAVLLRQRGVKPGDLVMVNLPFREQIAVTLAIFHEAAVVVPYIPEIARANEIDLRWLVTTRFVDEFPKKQQIVLDGPTRREVSQNPKNLPARHYPSYHSLMRIAFSSGTTGIPKAIPFSVYQVEGRALEYAERTFFGGNFMSLMPPLNGMGWWGWYACVIAQMPYIVPGSVDVKVDLLKKYDVESIVASSAQIAEVVAFLKKTNDTLPAVRHIQTAGSPLTPALVESIKHVTDAAIMNSFGSTEVGRVAMRLEESENPSYVGELVAEVSAEVVDEVSHKPVPDGTVGLLRVRSDIMAHEYLANEKATAETWRDGWFYPGDLAYLEGRRLFLAGRTAEVINVGGTKVDPAVIDTHFESESELVEHAAFAIRQDSGIEQIGLAFIGKPDIDVRAMIDRANDALKGLAPAIFVPVQKIPRNEQGKPQRRILTDWYAAQTRAKGDR